MTISLKAGLARVRDMGRERTAQIALEKFPQHASVASDILMKRCPTTRYVLSFLKSMERNSAMPIPHTFDNLFASHTFGRHHHEPAPLPRTIQQGETLSAGQMGGGVCQTLQQYAGSLPQDFDHLVRSIGEW